MANWKERYKKLRSKAGSVGGKLAAGAKDSAKIAGGGAAGAVVGTVIAPYLPKSIPYASGAALAILGHFARRKYPHIGHGLIGAGGAFLMMEVLQRNPNIAASLPGKATQQASGYADANAGAFGYGYSYGDAGALQGAEGYGYGEEAGALQDVGSFEGGYG